MTGPAVHSFQQPLPQALHQQQQPPGANNAQQQQQAGAGNTSNAISSSDGQVSAALGTKWAHAVNVRLILERRGDIRVVTVRGCSSWLVCGWWVSVPALVSVDGTGWRMLTCFESTSASLTCSPAAACATHAHTHTCHAETHRQHTSTHIPPHHTRTQIAKSPLSANTAVLYIVTAAGVQQAPDVDGQAAAEPVAPCSAVNMPITNAPPG